MFLAGSGKVQFLPSRTPITIIIPIITKAIGIEVLILDPVSIDLFGHIDGHSLTGEVLQIRRAW